MWSQRPGSVQKGFTFPDPGKMELHVICKSTGYKHTVWWVDSCSSQTQAGEFNMQLGHIWKYFCLNLSYFTDDFKS